MVVILASLSLFGVVDVCSPDNKHFAQVILRSDDGETWTEHVSDYVNSGEIYQVEEHCMISSHPSQGS